MEFAIADLVLIFVAILVSMSFHEAMHAFAGHWLGDPTARDLGRLSLNPFKHIDLFMSVLLPLILIAFRLPPIFAAKPVPFNPDRVKYDEFGAALIGVAGPLTNLFLAVAAAGIVNLFGPSGLAEQILDVFIRVNISFFVFNMIPFPPLDGSRLLYAFAPEPLQRFMYQIEMMGITAFLILFFVLAPVIGPLVGNISAEIYALLV